MTTLITASNQKKEDEKVIIEYIKDELFAKVKFIYGEKEDLAVEGLIYEDYKKRCKHRIGRTGMMAGVNHDTYMESCWTLAMSKHVQKHALAQKRSAVYTVMQNRFAGKSKANFPLVKCSLLVTHTLELIFR